MALRSSDRDGFCQLALALRSSEKRLAHFSESHPISNLIGVGRVSLESFGELVRLVEDLSD